MEKKTISAGIIGAGGFIGQEHLKRLTKRIDGVAVTALYDINKEKTDALAAAYGAESMELSLIHIFHQGAALCRALYALHGRYGHFRKQQEGFAPHEASNFRLSGNGAWLGT